LAQGAAGTMLAEKEASGGRLVQFDWAQLDYWTLVERLCVYSIAPLFGFLCFLFFVSGSTARSASLSSLSGKVALALVATAFVTILITLGTRLSGNLDSTYFRSLLEQREWRHFGFANSGCPFEGLYTLWNSQNYSMSLAVWVSGLLSDAGSRFYNSLIYLIISAELLVSITMLGRLVGLPWKVLCGTGLVALYLIFPTRGFEIHQIAALNVFAMELTALGILFLCLLVVSVKERPFKYAFVASLACGAALAYIAVYDLLGIVLLIPMFTIFGLAIFWDFGWKRYALMASFIGPVSIAILLVVKGQKDFSQPGFFAQELLNDRQSLYWVSILFQNVPGALVVGVGILGSIVGAFRRKGIARRIFCGTIVYTAAVLALGLITTANEDYLGPSMIYFEYPIWPLYFLGIASLVHEVSLMLSNARPRSAVRPERVFNGLSILVVIIVSLYAIFGATKPKARRELSWDTWPPSETTIIKKLASDIALEKGSAFKGYAYTQTVLTEAQQKSSPYQWIAIHLLDRLYVDRTGNDHRAFGLIYHGIPTVFQFGGLMSPRYYFCFSRIMGGGVEQMRSRVVANDLNPKFLEMIGVSRIISNEALSDPFRYTGTEEVVRDSTTLKLYALEDPNLGDYSPTVVKGFSDADEFVNKVRQGEIDFEKEVFLETVVSDTLSEATSSSFCFEQGGVRVRAKSDGRSLLVLPIEYSNCMRARSIAGKPVVILPANVVATGLLFEGEIEVVLTKRFGIFNHPLALLQDAAEFRKLLGRDAGSSSTR